MVMGFRDNIKDRGKQAFWGDGSPSIPKEKKPEPKPSHSYIGPGSYIAPKHVPQPSRKPARLTTSSSIVDFVLSNYPIVEDAEVRDKYHTTMVPQVHELRLQINGDRVQCQSNANPQLPTTDQVVAPIQQQLERLLPAGTQIEIITEILDPYSKNYHKPRSTCVGCEKLGATNHDNECTHASVFPRVIAKKPNTPYKPDWCPKISPKPAPTYTPSKIPKQQRKPPKQQLTDPIEGLRKDWIRQVTKPSNKKNQCVCGSFDIRTEKRRSHLLICNSCGNQWTMMNFPR